MSSRTMVLRAIEQKIESLFEGVFGRAFRTSVQPVELARKLAKEMDDHRTVSVSRVYVPNEYTVYLSSGDREQFEGYENSLLAELEEYLTEHAKRENYALLTPPRVLLETDDDLVAAVRSLRERRLRRNLDVNVVDDARIIRNDVEEVFRLLQSSDERIVGAFEDANHPALSAIPAAFRA